MMDDLLGKLTLEDLTGNAHELAEAIGMEAFLSLVKIYGGSSNLYVPKADQIVQPVRDRLIRQEFDGGNLRELSRKWNLSERQIREIVKDKAKEIRQAPINGQISLWK